MIIMDLKLDNIYSFKDFHINFSYPKKLVGSTIDNEYLVNRPNFRYKKVNVIIGTNASGKTTLGKSILNIFNFINKNLTEGLLEAINDKHKNAFFSIDYIINSNTLNRVTCTILPNDELNKISRFKIDILTTSITKKDSYESCVKKLKIQLYDDLDELSYYDKIQRLPKFGWFYSGAKIHDSFSFEFNYMEERLDFLNKILKTLDPSIKEINKSNDVKNGIVIKFHNDENDIILQNNMPINDRLSSGTKVGIDIAEMVSSIYLKINGFYYCDEKFSYIHSELEQKILNLMVEMLGDYDQLFFTTHNLDVLKMNFPIHSFIFLNKEKTQINVKYAENYIKKNNVQLRNLKMMFLIIYQI